MSVPVLTHRRDLRPGDLIFPEEILRIGRTLDFLLGCVSKEVQQEVFGPELDTGSLCDWLNLILPMIFAASGCGGPHKHNLLPEFWKEGASVPVSA